MNRPDVLVVGGGISGLASAVRLADAGFRVRLVARERPEATVSAVAAAVWHPFRADPPDRVLAWSRASYRVYAAQADAPETGVLMRPFLELFPGEAPWPVWAAALPGLHRTDPPPGYGGALAGTVPVIEAPVYLRWLEARLRARGVTVEVRDLDGLAPLLRPERITVVCAGLGARTLAGDDALYPIRGQVVRVANPGLEQVVLDEHGANGVTYIIPRRYDCILGGTALDGVWDRTPDPAVTATILRRTRRLEPRLEAAEVLEVRVGLRPGRSAVRLEVERRPEGTVVYNVGHGGSGYTLAWGCADEVLALVERLATA